MENTNTLMRVAENPAIDQVAEPLSKAVRAAYEAAGPVGQQTKNALHGVWLGHPLHPVFTDVPIGAWTTQAEQIMALQGFGRLAMIALSAVHLVACGATARLTVADGTGPRPILPSPTTSLIPTVNVVTAKGWSPDAKPVAAEGATVVAFARDLDHPRWLYVLPNGDVLVAETNAPPRPGDGKGIKGWFFKRYQKKAGGGVPSANRITLLRDADADGVPETRSAFLSGLNSPFGMALVGDVLYVANADALVRFPYSSGQTAITAPPTKVIDLPGGPLNHHWTKNVIPTTDGSKL